MHLSHLPPSALHRGGLRHVDEGGGVHASRLPLNTVRWFALAVAALAVAGVLAVVLVLARIPAIASQLALDTETAERSLVVHVNLATGVWFFSFVAALFGLGRQGSAASMGVRVATAGALALVASALTRAPAVLSDYVPVIDHWLFFAGLAAFAAGVVLDTVRWSGRAMDLLPPEVQHGVRAAAVAFAVAVLTIVLARAGHDPAAPRLARFEQLFWGGGHVLQFAATAGMLAGWLLLFRHLVGTSALPSRLAAALFTVLVAPTAIAPWLVATHHEPRAFTRMMELGIFPVVLIVIAAGIATAVRHGRSGVVHWPGQPIARTGLVVGVTMTLVGFVLGAAIRGDTTLTPAHYHISIGAVTVTFMATLLVLLPGFGIPICRPRLAMWQPLLYGAGQTVFALGLAVAGFWGGSARKLYGAARAAPPPAERLGWIIAGAGGLLALAGGVAFVAIVLGSVRRRRHALA